MLQLVHLEIAPKLCKRKNLRILTSSWHHLDILTSLERIIKQTRTSPRNTNNTFLTTNFNKHLKGVMNSNNTTFEWHKERLMYNRTICKFSFRLTRKYNKTLLDIPYRQWNKKSYPITWTTNQNEDKITTKTPIQKEKESKVNYQKINKMEHFLSMGHIPTHPPPNLTLHNLSIRTLTTEELNILDKRLSFAPTDITQSTTTTLTSL